MSIRKFIVAAAAVAAFMSAFADEEETDQGVGAIGWTPVQVGLFAPVSIPWGFDWDVKGLELDIFYAETVFLKGVSFTGIATRTRDEFSGVSCAGLCNWHEADVYGVDLSIGVNLAFKDVYGVQVGMFSMRQHMDGVDVNFVGAHSTGFRGVQVAGLCNFTYGEFKGIDIALGLSMANEIKGLSLGGINVTRKLTGAQVGFFNIADECPCGIQIGLVNIIMDNTIKVLPITNFYF